ncbi:hypothetical protein FHETE_90 [Fusarium heterosporum]|uniref:Uncharacterized protein n=1 Tax=Fusarium heterosporum TaxID=42747 RepID=A0A8H5U5H1_FUSHE|nr:hypothetical protein FHETE_90 [Fusarium heterosporum]
MRGEKKQRSTSARTSPYPVRTSSRIREARDSFEQPDKKNSQHKKTDKNFNDEIYLTSRQNRMISNGDEQNARALVPANSLANGVITTRQFYHHNPMAMPDGGNVGTTAGQVAQQIYGNFMKSDSALCKKLSTEPALRQVKQRRPEMYLNMGRRSNVEAFLAHLTGVAVERSCKNCSKGHGPWNECIIYDGQMCGSCTNCWFNASGSRCTFHENNQNSIYVPVPMYTPHSAGMPTQHLRIIGPGQPQSGRVRRQARLLQQAPALQQHADMIKSAVAETASMSQQDRIMARIETAARELGLRIGELREFVDVTETEDDETYVEQTAMPTHASSSQGTEGRAEAASRERRAN